MLSFSQPHPRGFTLVELVIVVAIIGVLTVLGLPAYQDWMENARIRTTAESIQNGLQVARAEAVKRNTQIRFSLGANSDWFVDCVTPSDTCPAGHIQERPTAEGATANIKLTTVPAGATAVIFNALGQVAPSPAPASFSQLDVNSASVAGARTLRVMLGVGGNVRMCDPALPVTDPRAC